MKLKTLAAMVAAALPLTAFAVPPHNPDLVRDGNRWTVTAYTDASAVHQQLATQGICFYFVGVNGTHQQYRWVSDTFPDWNGNATQEGDQVFMHGDYAEDVGHDGFNWELVTMSPVNFQKEPEQGFGHWHEWREDGKYGRTIGFANAHWKRVGKCDSATADEALERGRELDFPKDESGRIMFDPRGLLDRGEQ